MYQDQDVYLLSLRIEYFTNRAGLTEQYGVVAELTILATAAGVFKFSVVRHCVFIVCLAYYCSGLDGPFPATKSEPARSILYLILVMLRRLACR